jgi:hypothetical protein
MSDGRTMWWPKDSAWWRREYVVELGEEFGPAGPAVLDWLSCEASRGGRVSTTYSDLTLGCFVPSVPAARQIVLHAAKLGALLAFTERGDTFAARMAEWLRIDRQPIRPAVRSFVIERDRSICGLCGQPVPTSELHLDHIYPFSRGGDDTPENLQVAHASCNRAKGARVRYAAD